MRFPPYLQLDDLRTRFPKDFTAGETARAQTLFLKKLSLAAHAFYGGKLMVMPSAGMYGFGWFGVWYTPGVSAVSTAIRDTPARSFELSARGNLVAVVSDSTRVLGDGDCSPSGGLGVMEGKAFLMYYLGGMSAVPLCINSHPHPESHKEGFRFDPEAEHSAQKTIDFVRMAAPSFGAVNLEDISQPNCYAVLDGLQDCGIPVWHDDAQGTACVTLAGLINALKLTRRKWTTARAVFWGAGASNTTIVRLLLAQGMKPAHVVVFDSKGGLHSGRDDLRRDRRYYRKWEICEATNPRRVEKPEEALEGADVLIALSTPGPGVVPKAWISRMAPKAIVFACANPTPEIYPHEAKEAGAYIVATGRSDFPNQVNNSLGFPGILKGALLVRASKITDGMATAAARSLACSQSVSGRLDPDHILPTMEDLEIYPREAGDVAAQAAREGGARAPLPPDEVRRRARRDIERHREMFHLLLAKKLIPQPPRRLVAQALTEAVAEARAASAVRAGPRKED